MLMIKEGLSHPYLRDIKQKVIILIGWKPERAVYAKVKDLKKKETK